MLKAIQTSLCGILCFWETARTKTSQCVYDSYHDFVVLFSGMENMQQNTRVCLLMVAWLKIFETVS